MTSFFYLSHVFCFRLQAEFRCTLCTFVTRPRLKRLWLPGACCPQSIKQSTRPRPSTEAHLRPFFTLHPIRHSKSYGQVQYQWGRELDSACRGRKRGVNVCGMVIQTITYDTFNLWLVATWEEFWTSVWKHWKRCCGDQLVRSPVGNGIP